MESAASSIDIHSSNSNIHSVNETIDNAHSSHTSHSASKGLNASLDLATVLKAARSISQTVHLDELIHQLTTTILQSSGGDRCALILPDNDEVWQLQAIATLEATTLCTEPITDHPQLPVRLIQYVKNTQQVVVLDRLNTDLPVVDDYLQKHQPQSVLCLPLLSQGTMIGILYLHNLSTSGVFTKDRLSILSFLCTEAATSLEKANLYQTLSDYSLRLESKVKDRTQALEEEVRDRKQAQAAAEVANRVKSEFLANMSHELRSPLNAILGFSQVMMRSEALPKEHQSDVSIIRNSGEHLLNLINDVLDMSKIEAGRTTLNSVDFDLYDLLGDLHALFQLKATEKSLRYEVSHTPNLPRHIHTDLGKLRQILINLLSNAFKFTQSGHVLLHASSDITGEALTLTFEVQDSGPGIAADEIDTVFEPFVQTETGRLASQGTGLGLSISRKFAQLMDGDIVITSPTTQGNGTLVSTRIQAATTQLNASTYTPNRATQPLQPTRQIVGLATAQTSYRLLIVDDQQANRQLLTKLLQPLGFELQEASNGLDAIALCQHWKPHLVLMDIRMPTIDGIETTQRIRALSGADTQPKIVVLTASTRPQDETSAREAGCDAFISKPFQEDSLLTCIGGQLGLQYRYRNHPKDNSLQDNSLQDNPSNHTQHSSDITIHQALSMPQIGATPADQRDEQLTLTSSQQIGSPSVGSRSLCELSLSQLSPQLLSALESATQNFQWTEIIALIEEIRQQDKAVATALNDHLQQFQYTQILQAIRLAQAIASSAVSKES